MQGLKVFKVYKILLTGDKFIVEMHLRPLGITCNACGTLTKNTERILKI